MIENYEMIRPGHWYQKKLTGPKKQYDISYSKLSYDQYPTTCDMSALRYEYICGFTTFRSVCDFGYGNGAFLRHCEGQKVKTYGYDISDYPVPENVTRISNPTDVEVDLMTFFDSLEHLEEKDLVPFLSSLPVKWIVISVPWLHEYLGPLHFKSWKHRRENEHFHHFDLHGLLQLLNESGYQPINFCNIEDQIRKPVDIHPNILTTIARKR